MECELSIPKIDGLNDNELTVGRPLVLQCPITLDANTNIQALKLLQPVEQNYQLQLLKIEKVSSSQVRLLLTSYQTGKHQLSHLSLSDGHFEYPIPDQNIEVISVLEKDQPPKLNGPIGPQLIWPTLTSLMIGLIVFLYLLSVIFLKWFRYRQRVKLIEKLREHDSAFSPIQQLYQTLRKEQRQSSVFYKDETSIEENRRLLFELNHAFRLFLTRHYLLPAIEWKNSIFLKELKRLDNKAFEVAGKELKQVLHEFEKAEKDIEKLTKTDFVALIEHARKLCEKLVDPKRRKN